jgi:uncharacterized protein
MLEARELAGIDEIPAAAWNALTGTACPFLRHEFLAALEQCHCVGSAKGWTPAHIALFDGDQLVGALPAYRKTHSWGEFVFDFSWAQAFERHGLPYYPKLLCAIPFSPINSARLLIARTRDAAQIRGALVTALRERTEQQGCSSAHALFIGDTERESFRDQQWLLRSDVQFHWQNRGYHDYTAYLQTFRADKRKQMLRERRRCAEAGIRFDTLHGDELTTAQLAFVYDVHASTFHLHGHEPYLTLAFFTKIARALGNAFMVKLALRNDKPIAAAVFLASDDTLYGRYWGTNETQHSLHFEACYHQGIEYCIARGLKRFEPGTQGEHKVVRGFEPTQTWSAHYIVNADFRQAIADYLQREAKAVNDYAGEIAARTPFHRA